MASDEPVDGWAYGGNGHWRLMVGVNSGAEVVEANGAAAGRFWHGRSLSKWHQSTGVDDAKRWCERMVGRVLLVQERQACARSRDCDNDKHREEEYEAQMYRLTDAGAEEVRHGK